MARNEQLIRQLRILQILERVRYGKSVKELRDDLVQEMGLSSLSERSVRRDLDALQQAGIDVDVHDGPPERGRVWKLGNRYANELPLHISVTELLAFSLSRDLLVPLSGTPYGIGLESLWQRMHDLLPRAVWEHFQKSRQTLFVHGTPAKSYQQHQGTIKTLNRAIEEHRVLEFEYQSLGRSEAETRRVEPYGLVLYQNSLYLVAAPHRPAGEEEPAAEEAPYPLRHYKLDRFGRATALDLWFRPKPEIDLQAHLDRCLGIFAGAKDEEFRIRISAYAAAWVLENPWHPQQRVEPLPDGGCILTVRASHELEVIPRVLALGAEAELLEPVPYRARLAEMVERMTHMYRDGAATGEGA